MSERRLFGKIARMYYLQGLQQRDIANRLSLSPATVSRGLARAKKQGMVEIRIHDEENGSFPDLETEIEAGYGIRECIIVPSSTDLEATYVSIAHALGELFSRLLRSGDYLGVSWGETLKAVSDALAVSTPLEVNVIPIIGAMGVVETGIYPNAIAASFARKLGGQSYLVNTPAILDSVESRNTMRLERHFVNTLEAWGEISTVLLGIGGIDAVDSVGKYSILSEDELEMLRAKGAVTGINFTFVDDYGRQVDNEIEKRMIKMERDQIASTPNSVVVAAGNKKARAIKAALLSGMATVLLTDEEAARELLHLL